MIALSSRQDGRSNSVEAESDDEDYERISCFPPPRVLGSEFMAPQISESSCAYNSSKRTSRLYPGDIMITQRASLQFAQPRWRSPGIPSSVNLQPDAFASSSDFCRCIFTAGPPPKGDGGGDARLLTILQLVQPWLTVEENVLLLGLASKDVHTAVVHGSPVLAVDFCDCRNAQLLLSNLFFQDVLTRLPHDLESLRANAVEHRALLPVMGARLRHLYLVGLPAAAAEASLLAMAALPTWLMSASTRAPHLLFLSLKFSTQPIASHCIAQEPRRRRSTGETVRRRTFSCTPVCRRRHHVLRDDSNPSYGIIPSTAPHPSSDDDDEACRVYHQEGHVPVPDTRPEFDTAVCGPFDNTADDDGSNLLPSSALDRLSMILASGPDESVERWQMGSLPEVKVLELLSVPTGTALMMLFLFRFPTLESLWLQTPHACSAGFDSFFRQFRQRSAGHVRHVALSSCANVVARPAVLEAVLQWPQLETLRVLSPNSYGEMVPIIHDTLSILEIPFHVNMTWAIFAARMLRLVFVMPRACARELVHNFRHRIFSEIITATHRVMQRAVAQSPMLRELSFDVHDDKEPAMEILGRPAILNFVSKLEKILAL